MPAILDTTVSAIVVLPCVVVSWVPLVVAAFYFVATAVLLVDVAVGELMGFLLSPAGRDRVSGIRCPGSDGVTLGRTRQFPVRHGADTTGPPDARPPSRRYGP
jgi:hypothetical protein